MTKRGEPHRKPGQRKEDILIIQPRQVILYAEDDESDAFLFRHAFEEVGISDGLVIVPNGKAAIDYLAGNDPYKDRVRHPLPSLMLLDLKMPGISGLEVLKWIRARSSISTLLALILSSSDQAADIHRAYVPGSERLFGEARQYRSHYHDGPGHQGLLAGAKSGE